MKKVGPILGLACIVLFVFVGVYEIRTHLGSTAHPISVLFIGNSLTSTNDLPSVFSRVSRSLGVMVDATMVAPGGYTLSQHASSSDTISMIASRHWDVVVLQEQSQTPSFSSEQFAKDVIPGTQRLVDLIRRSNASTTIVLFETWGFKSGDHSNCSALPWDCTYEGMQRQISVNDRALATVTGIRIIPAGTAWQEAREAGLVDSLYLDDRHPTLLGTYLVADVFFATLFHRTVDGADHSGISDTQTHTIEKIADHYSI